MLLYSMTVSWHMAFLLIDAGKDLFYQHRIEAMVAWISGYVHIFADGCNHPFIFRIQ